ncbi:unnamed protein product [Chironomus riparius]|uniref:CRAL-TRIO domain-containing protein n=1 Tax=Chironomus riparius TaxID=315576 RepID=A0A9N9RXH7_9DIPT|nr:unnamed protein product [Chironomus riparius]
MSNKAENNDNRALQSLELFKNWLAKHPYLKYTGDDDIDDLLMACLRIKKFSMPKVYESFEFMVPYVKLHPDWYSNPTQADYEFTDKPKSPLIFLNNLDAEGRRIFVQKFKYFDDFNNADYFRRILLTPMLLFFDMDVQLNGVVAIFDYRDVNLSKLRKVPVQIIYDGFRASKSGLVRLKQLFMIGMPSFLKPILEIAKSFTSAKVLQRIHFINDLKELSQHMDVSVLPKEYGGTSTELMNYEAFELGVCYVNKIHKFDVNFSKIRDNQNVGSFRKLEID